MKTRLEKGTASRAFNKLKHGAKFAAQSAVVLAAGAIGSRLAGDPLPAMAAASHLLNKKKLPKNV